MSEMVSTLANVALKGSEYLFIFVNESNFSTAVQKAVDRAAKTLGESVATRGRVVRTYRAASRQTFEDISRKNWPPAVAQRIRNEKEPTESLAVVIACDFADFDPAQHDWAVVWLHQFRPVDTSVAYLFDSLQRHVQRRTNLFEQFDRWITNPTSAFPKGSLCSRTHPASTKLPTRRKRRSVLDAGHDVRGKLRAIAERGDINTQKHGWKIAVAQEISEQLGNFTAKSVCDRMERAGLFDEFFER